MYEHIKMVFGIVGESVREGKWMDIIHDQVWNHRIATPVVMDLTNLPSAEDLIKGTGLMFLEFKLDELQSNDWIFTTSSRRTKALRNLKRGWRGFAILDGKKVVGDMWCVTPHNRQVIAHPDLDMLGIRCDEMDAYAWDMLIDPGYRGKNLAVPLQKSLWAALKAEGYRKVYGYYWDSNIPALWMHRMLKYQELPKRWVSRFFSIKRAGWVQSDKTTATKTSSGS